VNASDSFVWVDGRFVPEARARVPATSATVGLGIGVFETLRIVNGGAPLLERHLARLVDAAATIGVDASAWSWADVLRELAARNRMRNGVARITLGPELALVTTRALPLGLAREREAGIALRSTSAAWAVPELKSTSRLALWRAEREAGGEVLLLGSGRRLLETSRANLFCVGDRALQTAPVPSVLPGVARSVILELARDLGVAVRQRAPRWSERSAWHEVFVTNAVRGVRPVVDIDGTRWSAPSSTSLTRQLQKDFDRLLGLR